MLNHTPVEHARWHMPVTALLLQCTEAPQNDSFTVGETVSDIGEIVTRVAVTHVRFSVVTTTFFRSRELSEWREGG